MQYELIIKTEPEERLARLRLLDNNGVQAGSNTVRLSEHSPAMWEGLFDTRRYVERYQKNLMDKEGRTATDDEILRHLGVFLSDTVLGKEIMGRLAESGRHRTLLIRLPQTGGDIFASAFARIPWEIARAGTDDESLMERNVVVRVVTEDTAKQDHAVAEIARQISEGDTLRILMVYAEAPGSRPLAMRKEREYLRGLFSSEILPKYRIEADVLCHGVTRDTLREQIRSRNGYHVVHWSGHGYHNLLELQGREGEDNFITGRELVRLFREAGGFIPQLVFLSACLSGTFVHVEDWASLQAVLLGKKPDPEVRESKEINQVLHEQTGYTGTALDLLRSGVPQVAAMRYRVGDDYARELAWWFYKRLFADTGKPSADGALALARTDLLQDRAKAANLGAVNHATPLMFGQEGRLTDPVSGRSRQMEKLRPMPQPLLSGNNRELDCPGHFVGRTREMTMLNTQWLSPGSPGAALIQGLAGLGKTVMAAEAVHLWHPRFDWVLAFQAKPVEIRADEFFRHIHSQLSLFSNAYFDKTSASVYMQVYFPPDSRLKGEARYERMRVNLVEALRDEAVLLVLDNFETNLDTVVEGSDCPCKDPQWDMILKTLSGELPDTRSRLLVTSRHRPSALSGEPARCLWIPLGPLPMGEAALFVRSHPDLSKLLFSGDDGLALVNRLLMITRGHPLIMNRLGALARDKVALSQAMDRLQKEGFQTMPDLFAKNLSDQERQKERVYLEDVATGSADLLIERLSSEARGLLWVVTLANEPVTLELIKSAWSEKAERPDISPVESLLEELHISGLLSQEESATYFFHELVRERIGKWMEKHPGEQGDRTREQVWIAFGERYSAEFKRLQTAGVKGAMEAASEAGRRALVYMVRAGAFDRLGEFASDLVTGTSDPALLRHVIAELETVADQVPSGKTRWSFRTYLADALNRSGQQDKSLALYEQAADEAEGAENWSDVGWICGNWAAALVMLGRLDEAKAMNLKSADACRKAGGPKVNVIGRELEAFRIDVMQGRAKEALPEIEKRVNEVRGWYQRHKQGETPPEAPEPVLLGRAFVSGLDIAMNANLQLKQWESCIELLKEIEKMEKEMGHSRQEQYRTRFNQYHPLMKLGRLDEAQKVTEECLAVFREADELHSQCAALSALANIWEKRGDMEQAIALARKSLSVRNQLPAPMDRAISHGNLCIYLEKANRKDESIRHQLAAGIYFLVSGHGGHVSTWMNNLKIYLRRSDGTYQLPKISELIAIPEFAPLKQFLEQWNVNMESLQMQMNQVLEQAKKEAEGKSDADIENLPPEIKQILAKLLEAVSSGKDIATALADLRTQLLQAAPGKEKEIDEILAELGKKLSEMTEQK
ncbi:MAG: CHAT domain-containing protein [Desulfobacterales bacterium]|nr:CHAT domain-containing protein [Desulfobacterales bacterium]